MKLANTPQEQKRKKRGCNIWHRVCFKKKKKKLCSSTGQGTLLKSWWWSEISLLIPNQSKHNDPQTVLWYLCNINPPPTTHPPWHLTFSTLLEAQANQPTEHLHASQINRPAVMSYTYGWGGLPLLHHDNSWHLIWHVRAFWHNKASTYGGILKASDLPQRGIWDG